MSKIQYQSMSQHDHVLHRNDMYIGSTNNVEVDSFVCEDLENFSIQFKHVTTNHGLMRIFIEVISNAIDNVWRSRKDNVKATSIEIFVNPQTGETKIKNDGQHIPIEVNSQTGLYNPHMIFGKLLTSSNYKDDEKRMTSGRNGLGVKLTNIFSSFFSVKCCDPELGKTYKQEWRNNMKEVDDPKITSYKGKSGSTEITWIPDFKRFGLDGYTPDLLGEIRKICIDCAMVTGISVYFNDKKIPVKNIGDYAKLYLSKSEGTISEISSVRDDEDSIMSDEPKGKKIKEEVISFTTPDSQVAIIPIADSRERGYLKTNNVSFVNGVYTYEGGVHVDFFSNLIFTPILDKINSKKGSVQVTMREMKNYFRLFIVSNLVNPKFTSQEKTKLAGPLPEKCEVPTRVTNAIMKWKVLDEIKDLVKVKDLTVLKKLENKRGSYKKIEGLDPANNAGGKYSKDCSLILCEGLSAKTYAVAGIQTGTFGKKGRDWFGIYPLRGKILNVRNASMSSISGNREVADMIAALNLKTGVDYRDDKNFATLNYGKLILLTDADVDGIHISSLIMNFFHALFPTILQRKEAFIICMQTPIVRIYGKSENHVFYNLDEFKKYSTNHPEKLRGARIKYFKGLGTSNDKEIKESFGKKMLLFNNDEHTDMTMNKVFNSKNANDRKNWLEHYNPEKSIKVSEHENMNNIDISDYLNLELIKFSIDDCKRSIPNIFDGLKESQRKILYAAFLKNLRYSGETMKVAQLAGFVAEKTNYHHGEQCLYETITKMANDYIGSNNIPYFFQDGQFGTRLLGGKDASNARYIFTKLDKFTELLFLKSDESVLKYVVEDGEKCEPQFYVPIIPTILVNGCSAGIGTGWSTSIPNYNPIDIINVVKKWIENEGTVQDENLEYTLPEIHPWYNGFTGRIEKVSSHKYMSYGTFTETDKTITITELPINMWSDKYKDIIEDWMENRKIKSYKNYCTPSAVHFIIEKIEGGIKGTYEDLKLTSSISLNNMVLFDEKGRLKKFKSIHQIIDEFCHTRLDFYEKRRDFQLNALYEELRVLKNRERFLNDVIDKKIIIFERDEEDVIAELEKKDYDKVNGGYGYLLHQQVNSFTKNKLEILRKDIKETEHQIEKLQTSTSYDLWRHDLHKFEKEYSSQEKKETSSEVIEEDQPKPKKKAVRKVVN